MFLMKNIRCCNLEISIRQFSLRSARKRAHDRIYGSAHFVEHGAVAGMPDILVHLQNVYEREQRYRYVLARRRTYGKQSVGTQTFAYKLQIMPRICLIAVLERIVAAQHLVSAVHYYSACSRHGQSS